jgi:hypothetical protein
MNKAAEEESTHRSYPGDILEFLHQREAGCGTQSLVLGSFKGLTYG